MRAAVCVALLAVAACGDDDACPSGYECIPIAHDAGRDGGVLDMAPRDASDLSADEGTPDAGPCGMPCEGATPVCDETTGTCVQCNAVDATACSGTAAPICDTMSGSATINRCVACLTNDECTTVGASECDAATHACVGCTADAACTRLTATPICDEGRGTCVACTGDTEAARCGTFSCRRSDGTCTTTTRASLDTCDACAADSECGAGRRCVEHVFMGTSTGSFCFLDASMGGCGDTDMTRRPFRTRTMLSSIDDAAGTYCMPPTGTTCQGIRSTQSTTCTVSADCGVTGLDDGYCPTIGTGAGLCSYTCGGTFDCAGTLNCGGTPAHCRP